MGSLEAKTKRIWQFGGIDPQTELFIYKTSQRHIWTQTASFDVSGMKILLRDCSLGCSRVEETKKKQELNRKPAT